VKHAAGIGLEEEIGDYVEIGEKYQKESTYANGPCDSIEQLLVELSVPTGQLQQWLNITEEVMDMVGTTEVQMRCHYGVHQGIEETNGPDSVSQKGTELRIHDDSVMKWFSDSHKAVKCHHSQQHGLGASQEVEEMKLTYASQERNCFVCGD
jgi:hypothetical protein